MLMFYKVLDSSLSNRKFQYKVGLNVYEKPVGKKSGFHFCKKKDIGYWLRLYADPVICEVDLCSNSVVFKERRKLKTDRFVLKNPDPVKEFMGKQDEDTLMDYVYDDGLALKYIENQTPDLCLFAVRQNGRAIQFVKEPSSVLNLEAVRQSGQALKYISLQTISLCMQSVKTNGLSLRYVLNKNPSLCMMAVHNNGLALQYIEEQTPYVCKMAVEQNGHALRFVKNQTAEIVNAAIAQNPLSKIWKISEEPIKTTKTKNMDWFYED